MLPMSIDFQAKKQDSRKTVLFFVSALPIFPVRLQTSIFGRSELNFRVRNGNGWTLALISTNCVLFSTVAYYKHFSRDCQVLF